MKISEVFREMLVMFKQEKKLWENPLPHPLL